MGFVRALLSLTCITSISAQLQYIGCGDKLFAPYPPETPTSNISEPIGVETPEVVFALVVDDYTRYSVYEFRACFIYQTFTTLVTLYDTTELESVQITNRIEQNSCFVMNGPGGGFPVIRSFLPALADNGEYVVTVECLPLGQGGVVHCPSRAAPLDVTVAFLCTRGTPVAPTPIATDAPTPVYTQAPTPVGTVTPTPVSTPTPTNGIETSTSFDNTGGSSFADLSTADLGLLLALAGLVTLVVALWATSRCADRWLKTGASHGRILLVGLAIVDFISDCAFAATRLLDHGGFADTIGVLALMFVVGPALMNIAFVFEIMRKEFRGTEFRAWFTEHSVILTALMLLAVTHIDVLTLLYSGVFPCLLGGRLFAAPFSDRAIHRLYWYGIVGNFVEDVPQVCLQVLTITRGSANAVLVVASSTSALALLFGIFRRALFLMLFHATADDLSSKQLEMVDVDDDASESRMLTHSDVDEDEDGGKDDASKSRRDSISSSKESVQKAMADDLSSKQLEMVDVDDDASESRMLTLSVSIDDEDGGKDDASKTRRRSVSFLSEGVDDSAKEAQQGSALYPRENFGSGADQTRRISVSSLKEGSEDNEKEARRSSVSSSCKDVEDNANQTRRSSASSLQEGSGRNVKQTRRSSASSGKGGADVRSSDQSRQRTISSESGGGDQRPSVDGGKSGAPLRNDVGSQSSGNDSPDESRDIRDNVNDAIVDTDSETPMNDASPLSEDAITDTDSEAQMNDALPSAK